MLLPGVPGVPADGPETLGPESADTDAIIEVPFDRLALDIVGPLPKTSRGH